MNEDRGLSAALESGDPGQVRDYLRAHSQEIDPRAFANSFVNVSFQGNLEMLQVMMEFGANVNACDEMGQTSLLVAVEALNSASVKFLLEHGADINIPDKYGQTALHCAIDSEVEKAHFESDETGKPVKPTAEVTRLLVARGADVRRKTSKGETPLDWAMSRRHKQAEAVLRMGEL
jgi:ankyrin repeat protein